MEHGGGNNSTFTTHVVTSSGTDTYATIAAALSSLKGPKHGGANIKAAKMLENIKENISNYEDDAEIEKYLHKILNKEVFDKQGLIYGIGHAIYSVSDPRFEVFKSYVEILVKEKGLEEEFKLYEKVARLAPKVISENRKIYKTICPNVDFYSGFVYRILEIPQELFTPLFAIARIVGWLAHRIEELINMNKIIRPAYESVLESKKLYKVGGKMKKISISNKIYHYYDISETERIEDFPYSLRVLLESLIRQKNDENINQAHIQSVKDYLKGEVGQETVFLPSRVVLQDFTGVPAIVDLAAMRDAMVELGKNPELINPEIPVDLVIDHSVQVDFQGNEEAFLLNSKKEFERNRERYEFLKWAEQSFDNFRVVPPATGIIHQVNIEYLSEVITEKNGILYPDSVFGTDSHTTMINALGVLGWG